MAYEQKPRDATPGEPAATEGSAPGEESAGTPRKTAKKAAKKKSAERKATKKKTKKAPAEKAAKKKTMRKKAAKKSEGTPAESPAGERAAARAGRGPTEEEIRRRAYEIWERRGREPGREEAHWLEAERELREEAGS